MWSDKIKKLAEEQRSDGKLPSYAFPGGYPIFYLDQDDSCLCSECAQKDKDDSYYVIKEYEINEENEELFCDECSKHIDSAWGDSQKSPDQATFEDLHFHTEE